MAELGARFSLDTGEADRATGFFLLERPFEEARWRTDERTELVIGSWMAKTIVLRADQQRAAGHRGWAWTRATLAPFDINSKVT